MVIVKKYFVKLKEYPLAIAFVVILCALLLVYAFNKEEEADGEIAVTDEVFEAEMFSEEEFVLVDVKGEVQNPGVYEISTELRVKDAIDLAGGLKAGADTNSVNLAQKVHDEMMIEVLHKELAATGGNLSGKININLASKEELQNITGVGPSKAEAIIEYREQNGSFQTLEDLDKVSGFGEKTIEKIKDEITW